MKYYQIKGNWFLSMVYSVTSRVIAALLLFFAISLSFVNAVADEAEEEKNKQAEQTAVIVVTDPDIAGAEDEEPDCE